MAKDYESKITQSEAYLEHPVEVFLRFLRFLAPYWDKVLFIILAAIVASPLGNIQLLFTRRILDECLVNVGGVLTPDQRWAKLWLYVGIGAALLWTGRALDVFQGIISYFIDFHLVIHLRKIFYKHLHHLPFSFFQNRPIGEHMFRCMNDIGSEGWTRLGIVNMITDIIPNTFRILNDMIWLCVMVYFMNPQAFVLVVIFMPPYTVLTYLMNTYIKRAFYAQRLQEQLVPAVLRDSIAGVETLKSYGRSRYMARKYVDQLVLSVRAIIKRDLISHAAAHLVLWLPSLLIYGGIWTWLIHQFMTGKISFGAFAVLLNITFRINGPFKSIIDNWQVIRQQLVPAQRILETLDVKPAIQDLPDAQPMPRVKGSIRFDNVSFAYDPAVPILKNVSFQIEPGQTVGIVGRSGAGKTTILNLLLRLHRPDSGRIYIDEHDLDKVRIQDWQDQIAIVMQETTLFGGDVAYNVRYGKLRATEEEIMEALRMADADEFVLAMPQGIHCDLHEGAKLSGGQKQRLGIARAMIRNPQVLFLDEPTSSLDSRTENEIWRSFERAMSTSTAVVISHRLATVRRADRILVMVHGEIVEEGSHQELLEKKGTYYSMWLEQTGQTDEEIEAAKRKVRPVAPAPIPAARPEPPTPKPAKPAPALLRPLPKMDVHSAFAEARKHKPVLGNALDLICQHELTPDLTAPMRTTQGQLKVILFALRYLKPIWHLVLLYFVIVIPSAMVSAVLPWSQALVVNIAQPQQNWTVFYIAVAMYWSIAVLFTPGVVMNWPNLVKVIITWYMGLITRVRLRIHFYRHLHKCSLRFFERRPVGEHMYRAQDDVDAIVGLITTNLPEFVKVLFDFAFFILLASWAISFQMTLVVLLYLIPFYICYHLLYTLIRRVDRAERERTQMVVATLQEGVSGVKTVKAFARQRHELKKYVSRHVFRYRMGIVRAWLGQLQSLLFGFIFSAGILPWIKQQIITIWTYNKVIYTGLPLGTAQVSIGYADQVTGPIQQIINLFNQIRLALIPAERVMETMSVEPMVSDKAHARKAPRIEGAISFEDVRFSYDPGTEVLKGASFRLQAGESVGVVGPSGAGKSTISKLALRLYDPDSGRIIMDGWDIADMRAESYQKQLSIVMQETYLFGGSIRDNILFSKPDATEAEIWDAIDAAELREFVEELPNGLDTNLAEGTRLSGGQKQRIGIARALVRQPRLLILDEPTASLDSTTEAELMQTLWKVMKGRTTIIISHRLALVRPVDRILVVEEGRIVEDDNHDRLLAQNGLYATLWNEQYGEGAVA